MEQMMRELLAMEMIQTPEDDVKRPDSSETVHISALALLKMLRHARSGVPLEVMGILLGEFVDDYTINIVDCFSTPQKGSTVTVESFDPAYQAQFIELIKLAGRKENAVGWYHSHPGFGCWLSSTDLATQGLMEKLHERCVAIVIDPIQSVKGKVVIDAFRSIDPMKMSTRSLGSEARQVTTNMGHLNKPTISSVARGLGTKYYSLAIDFNCYPREQKVLLSLTNKSWNQALQITHPSTLDKNDTQTLEKMGKILKAYNKELDSEQPETKREAEVTKYDRLNSKHHLKMLSNELLSDNIMQMLGTIANAKGTAERNSSGKKIVKSSLRSPFHIPQNTPQTLTATESSSQKKDELCKQEDKEKKR